MTGIDRPGPDDLPGDPDPMDVPAPEPAEGPSPDPEVIGPDIGIPSGPGPIPTAPGTPGAPLSPGVA